MTSTRVWTRLAAVAAVPLAVVLFGASAIGDEQPGQQAPAPGPDDPKDRPPEALLKPDALLEGKRTFDVHCTSCHGVEGMGGIGPALTDTETLHGGGYSKILTVITNGVEEKGMPRWIVRLGPEKVFQVAAYVYTIRGTRPPGKKGAIRFSIIALVPGAALLWPEADGP